MNKTKFGYLNYWTCFFLDSENGIYPTTKQNFAFKCRTQGKFLFGNEVDSQHYGHAVCIFITVLIVLVGTFGVLSNVINMFVLPRSLKGSSLKELLIVLAAFECLACVSAIIFSAVTMTILEDSSRSKGSLVSFRSFGELFSFFRTGANYITILVSIERYLVVAFPIRSKSWLSTNKSRIYVLTIVMLAILMNLPWGFTSTVVENDAKLSPETSLGKFPFIFQTTKFGKTWFKKIMSLKLVLDYVLPLPLLLIVNALLYYSIYRWNKNRKCIKGKQQSEIKAAKMFSVIALVLLLCHSVSCIIFFSYRYSHIAYREMTLLQSLSVTLSAAINFLVYMGFGKAFRDEFKIWIATWTPVGKQVSIDSGVATQISRDKESSSVTPHDKERVKEEIDTE
ncbi:unnamed protein product [Orchesella dallaii]|uniref:G-protein coupled receptors family 1 profile domain-containing protein n=1 Tax=Orchesella dallaii TaxID=48710 RepID=A0ABP1PSA1_9HEXA